MNFYAARGKDFVDTFEFKNAQRKPISVPSGTYKIVLERGPYAREYTPTRGKNGLVWKVPAAEINDFEYSTLYYTLYLNNKEVARGTLSID